MKLTEILEKLGKEELGKRVEQMSEVLEKECPCEMGQHIDTVLDPFGASDEIKLACGLLIFGMMRK